MYKSSLLAYGGVWFMVLLVYTISYFRSNYFVFCSRRNLSSLSEVNTARFIYSDVSQIELDSPEEVNEKFLYDEVHPTSSAYRPKFDKPKPPIKRARSPRRK